MQLESMTERKKEEKKSSDAEEAEVSDAESILDGLTLGYEEVPAESETANQDSSSTVEKKSLCHYFTMADAETKDGYAMNLNQKFEITFPKTQLFGILTFLLRVMIMSAHA
jgi:hypothetical protein